MRISRYCCVDSSGFVLLELLMVFVIIGTLASIAIPHYAEYREDALAAQCQANRYHIEIEELAYFAENGEPRLTIDDKYTCPHGGTYVWLVMDPEDPRYPQIGCSVHFTGSATETSATAPETEDEIEEDISAAQLIDDLIAYVYNLNLTKKVTNSLIKNLNNALKDLEKGKSNEAINNLNNFINNVEDQQKKNNITPEVANILISKANRIKNIL